MKADERKHLEQNELLRRLTEWWKGWKTRDGKTSNTVWIVLGASVLVLLLVIGYRYYESSAARNRSNLWAELYLATTGDQLKDLIDKNKGTPVARAAKAQLARLKFQDGVNNLGVNVGRAIAIKDLVRAKELYEELAKEASDDADLVRESMLCLAKIEESLTAIPNPDQASAMLGNLDAAEKLYEQFASQTGDKTELGKKASERAKDIREHKETIQKFYEELQKHFVKPELPPLGPDLKPPDLTKPPDSTKPADPMITPIPGKPTGSTPVGPVLQPVDPMKPEPIAAPTPDPAPPKPK
jgi:hypothetical protein